VLFTLVIALALISGLALPARLANPAQVEANPGISRWDIILTPGSISDKIDILPGSEINRLATSPGNRTLLAVTTRTAQVPPTRLYSSTEGRAWGGASAHLFQAMINEYGTFVGPRNIWDVAIAPDDSRFWAVVTSDAVTDAPREVWVTRNGGGGWEFTNFSANYISQAGGPFNNGFISSIDISPSYGGARDIAVGIRNCGSANADARLDLWVFKATGFTGWVRQTQVFPVALGAARADVLALKFSPTYSGDASLAVVFSDNVSSTFFDIAIRDLAQNTTLRWAYANPLEIKDPDSVAGSSPDLSTIISADLELPSDFSGQSPSLRRAYVSIDGLGAANPNESGIYRIDDTHVYELMDTTGQGANGQRISSIAYYGTFASGKLLAGEVMGFACTASVPTWFTDSPTVCPIPCWYPALKPPTGAAGQDVCGGATKGQGNAQVAWNRDGSLAYAATGSSPRTTCATWFQGFLNVPISNDESAFSISRNNSETWNQTGLIDTTISWLNDVAPSPDCTTIYVASSNNSTGLCSSFDSVWRASLNPAVVSPFTPIAPIDSLWERVLTRVTAIGCTEPQTELPILRLAPDKTDGELVGWAAQGTRAQLWSPDFGDFWARINPRNVIQDFAFESSTLLWNVDPSAIVQKLPYTGTAWSSAEPDMDGKGGVAHMIAVKPEGKILIGLGNPLPGLLSAMSYSLNGGEKFGLIPAGLRAGAGSTHVAFDNRLREQQHRLRR